MHCERFGERSTPLEVLNFRAYEPLDALMLCLLTRERDVVFDIGGNIGYYAILLAQAKQLAQIYCFEPIPSTYAQLLDNIARNNLTNRIKAHNIGLFDTEGEKVFYVYAEDVGNASATLMREDVDNKRVTCIISTIDQYVRSNNITRIDVIKCDVEGAELFVLHGGIESIKAHKPLLLVEMLRKWADKYNYHPNEIITLLQSLGYGCYFAIYDEKGLGLKELEVMTESTTQTNFFFLHKIKHSDICKTFVR